MERKELGQVTAEFEPSKERGNPRNSEGAFLRLKDGSVLFVYSLRGTGARTGSHRISAPWCPKTAGAVLKIRGRF